MQEKSEAYTSPSILCRLYGNFPYLCVATLRRAILCPNRLRNIYIKRVLGKNLPSTPPLTDIMNTMLN